jgi:division protein CdvB (Snf7/Vps24/ESCRT-III family)
MDQRSAQKELSRDQMDLERMMRKNEFEQKQAEKKIQTMVKAGKSKAEIRPYAKNVLTLRQQGERLAQNRNKFSNAKFQIDNAYTNQKMMQNMEKVNNTMQKVSGNVDINKIAKTAADMQMNMEKMNIATELMDDAMDGMEDDDDDEDSNVNALLDGMQDKLNNTNKQKGMGTQLRSDEQVEDQFAKMMREAGL